MARILVTGGAGYLGAVLVPRLLAAGHRVTVLDDFRYAETSLLACVAAEGFTAVRGDVRDETLLKTLVREADFLLPFAGLVGAPACERSPVEAVAVNRDAVLLLERLRAPSQRILFPTTNSGYGTTPGEELITEDHPLRPITLYGRTKVEAEEALLARPNVVTFRLATVFGVSPRLRLDLLVNDFTYRAYRDRSLVLYEGHFVRNYVAVEDVADLFVWAVAHPERLPDGAYNFGLSDANLSKRELCELIAREVPGFTWVESSVGRDPDRRNYRISNGKIEAAGFRAVTPVREGVRRLLKAFAMLRPDRYGNA